MSNALPNPEQRLLVTFTSQQWTGRPGQDAVYSFLGLGIVGFVACLVLMIFIAGLRDPGAAALFIVVFAVALTTFIVLAKSSSEKKFLIGINQRVNDTILELTGNPDDQLSLRGFRRFIESEQRIPLPVHGVPGLELVVVREGESAGAGRKHPAQRRTAPPNPSSIHPPLVTTTELMITVTPPDYGTTSFDRLLNATLDTD
ncbi:hypothetical protein [Arthrobacter sp. ES3-54]|jgi:hypothetical protein|uniref:hypothetical protein n=1 Tax=Arthrobacter sp. ES3-54 TaxID=1502991 RepID=UPI002405092C|nr:hypothetical protein [Arthrobacter sp. ES3-54]MDF9751584.1 hypothetical protein [Arthrobacter sp. ES3-54]